MKRVVLPSLTATAGLLASLSVVACGHELENSLARSPARAAPGSAPQITTRFALPIEVLGFANEAQHTTRFSVDDPEGIDAIELTIQDPIYEKPQYVYSPKVGKMRRAKLSIAVSATVFDADSDALTWYALDDTNLRVRTGPWEVDPRDAPYGGLNATLPVMRFIFHLDEALQRGENAVHFRFHGTDGETGGFRVIHMSPRRAGEAIWTSADFDWEQPSEWDDAEVASSEDIAEGRTLWHTAPLKASPLDDRELRGHCADCHADDGLDLKVFNYSPRSIAHRAQFHGLTAEEARKLAAYIQAIDLELPPEMSRDDAGRPWNPPYQPGPGLREGHPIRWVAGAGLEAVLDDDSQMRARLFPRSPEAKSVSNDGDFWTLETQLPLQLPSWNRWLPKHTIDGCFPAIEEGVLPDDEALASYSGHDYLDIVRGYKEVVANRSALRRLENGGVRALERFTFAANRTMGQVTRYKRAACTEEEAKHAIRHFESVKLWELVHGNGLEDLDPQARRWPTTTRNVFELAPHRLAEQDSCGCRHSRCCFAWQSLIEGKFWSTSWYQLQTVINDGRQAGRILSPVDWNYQPNHVADLANKEVGGPAHPYRLAHTFLHMIRSFNHSRAPQEDFGPRQLQPARYCPSEDGTGGRFGTLSTEDRRRVYATLLSALMDLFERLPIEDWKRVDPLPLSEHLPHDAVQRASYTPRLLRGSEYTNAVHRNHFADAFLSCLPRLKRAGVSEAVLQRMVSWAEEMWPKGGWSQAIS